MKSIETKKARHLALLNVGAFIDGHGEEGGIVEDELGVNVKAYLREAKHIAEMLYKMAADYKVKYNLDDHE